MLDLQNNCHRERQIFPVSQEILSSSRSLTYELKLSRKVHVQSMQTSNSRIAPGLMNKPHGLAAPNHMIPPGPWWRLLDVAVYYHREK